MLRVCKSLSRYHALTGCRGASRKVAGEEARRITMPQKFVKRLDNILKKRGDNPMNYEALAPSKQKRGRLVIECSDKRKNHYDNTLYRNWNENILFSSGWKQAKRVGERFSVLPIGGKPFFSLTSETTLRFDHFDLDGRVVAATRTQFSALRKPTSIQAQAIPEILSCANVLMAAESGAGKTLAYLLPIISTILRDRDSQPVQVNETAELQVSCLIMVPSRELIVQLDSLLRRLCSSLPITFLALRNTRDFARHVVATGGESDASVSVLDSLDVHRNHPFRDVLSNGGGNQKHVVNRIDILLCTPHTATQLHADASEDENSAKQPTLNFSRLRWLVLDEADTLLDESFSSTVAEFVTKSRLQLQCELPDDEESQDDENRSVSRSSVAKSDVTQDATSTSLFSNYYIDDENEQHTESNQRQADVTKQYRTPIGTQLILSCATLPALFGSRESDFQTGLKGRSFLRNSDKRPDRVSVSESVARHFIPLDSCVQVTSGHVHLLPVHIRHTFVRVRKSDRLFKLCELLNEAVAARLRCVVFANGTNTVREVHRLLVENGLLGELLVSKQRNNGRQSALRRFANGDSLFLVGSDLASRGIDFRCDRVFNYELPFTMADYLHRAGRAGRLDPDGLPAYADRSRARLVSRGNYPECISLVATRWEIERVQRIEMSVRRGEPFGADLLGNLDRFTVHDDDQEVDESDFEEPVRA